MVWDLSPTVPACKGRVGGEADSSVEDRGEDMAEAEAAADGSSQAGVGRAAGCPFRRCITSMAAAEAPGNKYLATAAAAAEEEEEEKAEAAGLSRC